MEGYVSLEAPEELLEEIVRVIEEVKPPSRLKVFLLYLVTGIIGGMGLGAFLGVVA